MHCSSPTMQKMFSTSVCCECCCRQCEQASMLMEVSSTYFWLAVSKDVFRPLRQFLLGPLYCPEFGLTGDFHDSGFVSYLVRT